MKFSVPTNFQADLISSLGNNKKDIDYIYGKLADDFIGGGRPSMFLPSISRRYLKKYVSHVHAHGWKFNYLLNSACLGNREYTISGQKQIRRLIDWLVKIKVDSVTVAIPYLAQLIKKKYPGLELHVSNLAYIDSVIKAKYWQDLGADVLVLASSSLNRDFETLNKIRRHVKCRLELIANNACLYRCPIRDYHRAMIAHASQKDNASSKYFIDYCIINCRNIRLKDPVNFIRADWIRPEDVRYYEAAGIDYLKIVDRSKSTAFISRAVGAYINRSYKGNLVDLFIFSPQDFFLRGVKKYLHSIQYLFRPFTVNIFKVRKIFKPLPLDVHIDNEALDGFLEFFVKGKCKQGLCDECGYCREIAKKTVKINEKYLNDILLKYKNILDDIILGAPFRYF